MNQRDVAIEFGGLCGFVPTGATWEKGPTGANVLLPSALSPVEEQAWPRLAGHVPLLAIPGDLVSGHPAKQGALIVIPLIRRAVSFNVKSADSKFAVRWRSNPKEDDDFEHVIRAKDIDSSIAKVDSSALDDKANKKFVISRVSLPYGTLKGRKVNGAATLNRCYEWFLPGGGAHNTGAKRRAFSHRQEFLMKNVTSLSIDITDMNTGKPAVSVPIDISSSSPAEIFIGNVCGSDLRARILGVSGFGGAVVEDEIRVGECDDDVRHLWTLCLPKASWGDRLALPAPVLHTIKGGCGGYQKPRCFSVAFEP